MFILLNKNIIKMKRKLSKRNLPCKLDFKLLSKLIEDKMNETDKIIDNEFSDFNEPKIIIKNNRITIKSFMKFKNYYINNA